MSFTFLSRAGILAAALGATAASALAQPPPQPEWTFAQVITTAVAQHPLVEAARVRVAAAEGGRITAGALPNPVMTYWVENAPFPGQQRPFGVSRETSTYVTLPLEPLFQRAPRMERATEEIRAAEAEVAAAHRQVALEAAAAFFRVALGQVAVEAAEENRVGLESLVAYNASRVREGATPEIDLIRAQVELDRAANNVVLAEVDVARSRADLWPFLSGDGRAPVAFRVTLPPAAAGDAIPLPTLTDLLSQAHAQRPELLSVRARVAVATAETAFQRRLAVRQLGATVGFKNVTGGNSAIAGSNTVIAGVSVPLPLFNRNRGDIQRASEEALAAQHELTWQERTVTAAVQGAYDVTQRLSAQVSRLQTSFLARADEGNRITLAAYQEGAATLLQVLDASRTLAEARLTYYRTLFAERQSVFDLALAAGRDPAAALASLQTTRVVPSDLTQGVSR